MAQASHSNEPVDARGALAGADHLLAVCAVLLGAYVAIGPSRLLDDEVLTRVRALTGDLATQVVGKDHALTEPVRAMLAGNRTIMLHLHALAIELRLIAALSAQRALDPLLAPLVMRRIAAGGEAEQAATAWLAAQSRLVQDLRRMRLSLAELPGDLHAIALAVGDAVRSERGLPDPVPRATASDDTPRRFALVRTLLAGLGEDTALALRIDDAGVPLFLSALATASGQIREMVVLATAEDHPVRLALMLRAAGLHRDDAARQLLAIRPDADPAPVDLAHDAGHAQMLLNGGRR